MNRHPHKEIIKQSLKRNSINAPTSISSLLPSHILNWKLFESNNYQVNGFHHGRWLDSTKSGTIHCSLKKRKEQENVNSTWKANIRCNSLSLKFKPKIHFRYIQAKNDYFYKLWMFSLPETAGCCSWSTGGTLYNSDMMDRQKWGKKQKILTLSYCSLRYNWQ